MDTHTTSDQLKDPVCGMPVRSDAPLHFEHDGTRYGFCSPHCLEAFKARPDTYLHGSEDDRGLGGQAHHAAWATGTGPSGGDYTCPMHPEIVRDEPAACPLCGMALEP